MIFNFDYIFFVFGLTFILLAIILFSRSKKLSKIDSIFSWNLLAIFSLLFGLTKWFNILFIFYDNSIYLKIFYYIVFYSAFLFLFEFARLAWQKKYLPFFSRWIYFFLFCALIISYIFNFIEPISFLRLFIVFFASILSGLILFLHFLKNKAEKLRFFILFLSLFLFIYFFNIYFYLFNVNFPFDFLKAWHFFDNSCFFIDSFNFIFASCAVLYFWFFDFKIFNDKRGRITTLHQWLVFLLLMVFIISGFFMINFRSDLIKDDLKYKLLFQASKIAHQINPDLVDALNFNSEDKNLAEFERIKSYLNSYANILGIESIYTIAKIDDNLFFGPESIDPSSDIASDPGTLYERVNPLFYEIFENKEALFLDSYQDEYGSFVSAAAPVISSKSGEVSMLLAIDISTDHWNKIINSERIRVIYFIFFATLFILIGSILLNLRRKDLRKEKKYFII